MNDFLEQVWLDNTIGSYLLVAGIIIFIIIVKRLLATYFAGLLFLAIRTLWKDIDKKSFTSLVAKPLGQFLVIFVTIGTLYKLQFPTALQVDVYRISLITLLHSLSSLVIVIAFIRLLLRIIDFIAVVLHIKADRTHDTTDNQLIVFFKDFFKVILGIIGLLMILKFSFGLNIGNLLTGLSIVGAAIALALRESLENLIASFIIFFDKPFSMGDAVKIHTFSGTVEKIGLRSTRIRTDQKTFITVPNKQMVDSILDNLSQRTQRKGELRLEIGLNTNADKLSAFLEEMRKLLDIPEIESSSVLLNDITPSAFAVAVDYFTGPVTMNEFNSVKENFNFQVLRLLELMEVEIAGANSDIRILNSENRSTPA